MQRSVKASYEGSIPSPTVKYRKAKMKKRYFNSLKYPKEYAIQLAHSLNLDVPDGEPKWVIEEDENNTYRVMRKG